MGDKKTVTENHHVLIGKSSVAANHRTQWAYIYVSGWWYTYPSEKYESQLGYLFPIYGKIKAMFQTTKQV